MCNCNARNTSSEKTDEKHGATGKRKQSEANETDNQISQHFAYPGVRKRKLPEVARHATQFRSDTTDTMIR
jgi:hypothetical protein